MWLNTPISNSNFNTIERFDIIADMANTMKSCHVFYVSSETGMLYGCPEEPYCLHELPIPSYAVPSISFSFRYDTLDMAIVKQYRSFILFDNDPWCMIPSEHYSYTKDYVRWWKQGSWKVVDQITGRTVEFLDLYNPDDDKSKFLSITINTLMNKLNVERFLGPPTLIEGLETIPQIIEVVNSKVTIGRRYIELYSSNGKKYEMFVFRNLFNLNKNDKLDVIIRDRLDNNNLYEACFLVRRKKNPIQYIFDPYVEKIYTQFIHM